MELVVVVAVVMSALDPNGGAGISMTESGVWGRQWVAWW